MNKISMATKITGAFIILTLLASVLLGVVSIVNIQSATKMNTTIRTENIEPLQPLNKVLFNFMMIRINLRDALLAKNDSDRTQITQKMNDTFKELNVNLDKYAAMVSSTEEAANLQAMKQALSAYEGDKNQVMSLLQSNQASGAVEILNGDGAKQAGILDDTITKAFQINVTQATDRSTQSESNGNRTILIMVLMMVGVSVVSGVIGAVLSRSITRPLLLGVGDLSENASQVASASEQLAASSQSLAESNGEQAASIEETSATLEETSSMIQQNSENTRQALHLAAQTRASADKGNNEMKEMMTSMNEIKKSSDQIAKIIKVIDEIAFQTNILALNAAVEAARAGDAGMGFAVVAEEVRNLAQRSAQAAKDTAAMIESNISLSERGVDVSRRVGEALAEITTQAKKVNELMDEIAAASQEQTQGVSQITKAMSQMEKATQMNASTAEESAAAAEELSAQAQSVSDTVRRLMQLVQGENAANSNVSAAPPRRIERAVSRPVQSVRRSAPSVSQPKTMGQDLNDIIPFDKDHDDF